MRVSKLVILPLLVLAAACAPPIARAQHEHEAGNPEQLGRVHFPVSCNAEAQKQFERALAMLHSFWFEASEQAFSKVTELDPSCAMGYWGIAMSLFHPIWPDSPAIAKGLAAVEKAKAASAKTARERDYISAIEVIYRDADKLNYGARKLAYEKAMEQIHVRYPDDREAAAFYALAVLATADPGDKTYSHQKKAGAILEKLFVEERDHPGVAHYIIHVYDYPPLAGRALPAARRYTQIAPSVPHALHMPSHIFTRLGLWQDAIASNLASEAAAKDYEKQVHMAGAWDQQLHAMDYLEYAYLQGAQDREAGAILDELNSIEKAQPAGLVSAYAFAAIPARYAIERHDWAMAAKLQPRLGQSPATEAIVYFARAMGASRTGDLDGARADLEKLSALHDTLLKASDTYWADQVDIQWQTGQAWKLYAEGRLNQALVMMREAVAAEEKTEKHPVTPGPVIPARELLGDMLLEMNQPQQALVEYESSLQQSPNRFHGLYGAAHAARLDSDAVKAKNYYTQLLAVAKLADGNRPEPQEAHAFLKN